MSWLSLTASVDIEVLVDDQPVRVSSLAVPLPVDVGVHRARFEQRGFEPWSTSVDVGRRAEGRADRDGGGAGEANRGD